MNPVIINGNTELIALLGNPVRHSLSPVIHNHLFDSMNLPYAYIPFKTDIEHLESAVRCIKHGNFAGANVTVPFKKAVIPFCDSLSELSKLTGTVNTLFFREGGLHGTTTDADGFFRALEVKGFDVNGTDIVILGNGGTARTIAFALIQQKKPAGLTIAGRNPDKVNNLINDINYSLGSSVKHDLFSSDTLNSTLENCGLLVNCTPLGMHPNIEGSPLLPGNFHKDMNVFDAVYNPPVTRFLTYAKQAGCKTENGLRMLLYQGLESFKYWTGQPADESLIDLNELEKLISK